MEKVKLKQLLINSTHKTFSHSLKIYALLQFYIIRLELGACSIVVPIKVQMYVNKYVNKPPYTEMKRWSQPCQKVATMPFGSRVYFSEVIKF